MYQDYSRENFSVGSVSDSTFGHDELLIISAWWIGMDILAEWDVSYASVPATPGSGGLSGTFLMGYIRKGVIFFVSWSHSRVKTVCDVHLACKTVT